MKDKLFRADHCRVGTIRVTIDTCNVCNEKTTVIAIDSSQEEYGPGCVCEKCAIRLFRERENANTV